MHYLGSQIVAGFKGLEKRQFIVITDKYLVLGKFPRIPDTYLYSILGGIVKTFKPGDVRYGPEDVRKVMESLDKHKVALVPLDQLESIDVVMPKKGFSSSKKGYIVIRYGGGEGPAGLRRIGIPVR